jgi:hypothetical protein
LWSSHLATSEPITKVIAPTVRGRAEARPKAAMIRIAAQMGPTKGSDQFSQGDGMNETATTLKTKTPIKVKGRATNCRVRGSMWAADWLSGGADDEF